MNMLMGRVKEVKKTRVLEKVRCDFVIGGIKRPMPDSVKIKDDKKDMSNGYAENPGTTLLVKEIAGVVGDEEGDDVAALMGKRL